MGYNTKINLSNDKVCQNSGDTLTLSGNTVITSVGDIRYASDINFTGDTQIITKKYVDDNINSLTGTTSQAITGASNGLTKDGQVVCLGGVLNEITSVQVPTTGGDLILGGNGDPNNHQGGRILLHYDTGSTANSCLKITTKETAIGETDLVISPSAITVSSDYGTFQGIKYDDNYCKDYVDRSLVDKAYVDDNINSLTGITSQAITGAGNGLGTDGQNICLGGKLTKNTYINTDNLYGIAFGCNVQATGSDSFAIGHGGYYTMEASGDGSFVGGFGDSAAIKAVGKASFVFGYADISNEMSACSKGSALLGGKSNTINTDSDYSVIIGGSGNHISEHNDYSVVLGGSNINITSSSLSNHAIVPSLAIFNTPSAGSATTDAVLVWNSTDKKVKQVSAANLGEDNNIYDATIITTDVTLTTGSTYVQLVNSPTSGVTITLPVSPIDGQVFRIKDAAGTALDYNITIARNGKLIDGGTTDGVLNTDSGALEVVYNNTLGSWYVFSFVN
jgi:hypothetical protein